MRSPIEKKPRPVHRVCTASELSFFAVATSLIWPPPSSKRQPDEGSGDTCSFLVARSTIPIHSPDREGRMAYESSEFQTTQWSLVARAGNVDREIRRKALNDLL